MSAILVDASCKGSKCNRKKERNDARGEDREVKSDALSKVDDIEAKKREKPKSSEESEEEKKEENKAQEAEVQLASSRRRRDSALRRQPEMDEPSLHQHVRHRGDKHKGDEGQFRVHRDRRDERGVPHTHHPELKPVDAPIEENRPLPSSSSEEVGVKEAVDAVRTEKSRRAVHPPRSSSEEGIPLRRRRDEAAVNRNNSSSSSEENKAGNKNKNKTQSSSSSSESNEKTEGKKGLEKVSVTADEAPEEIAPMRARRHETGVPHTHTKESEERAGRNRRDNQEHREENKARHSRSSPPSSPQSGHHSWNRNNQNQMTERLHQMAEENKKELPRSRRHEREDQEKSEAFKILERNMARHSHYNSPPNGGHHSWSSNRNSQHQMTDRLQQGREEERQSRNRRDLIEEDLLDEEDKRRALGTLETKKESHHPKGPGGRDRVGPFPDSNHPWSSSRNNQHQMTERLKQHEEEKAGEGEREPERHRRHNEGNIEENEEEKRRVMEILARDMDRHSPKGPGGRERVGPFPKTGRHYPWSTDRNNQHRMTQRLHELSEQRHKREENAEEDE